MPMDRFKVACIQVNAGSDIRKNLKQIRVLTERAVRTRARFLVFPETFFWRGPNRDMHRASHLVGAVVEEFKAVAAAHGLFILLGSVLKKTAGSKFANTSLLISDKGRITAEYRKIHLFDVNIKDVRVRESKNIQSGKKVVIGKVWGIPTGLSICYDLRFPELYRKMSARGARILCVPANFTYKTGEAHWETLLRARAIENQCYVVAPGQTGIHPGLGIRTFGSSMIIDPWGRVLARASRNAPGIITAEIRLKDLTRLRASFPALKHRRV